MQQQLVHRLSVLLADTYALYLKTQNYHWHVIGPLFKPLHGLFEEQYQALAEAVDSIAERIRILGHQAPATFGEFQRLKTVQDGHADATANQMLTDLVSDHTALLRDLGPLILLADKEHDTGTLSLLEERVAEHEKMRWMLSASCELG
jgi:starvation-inducible DNA-binding protein